MKVFLSYTTRDKQIKSELFKKIEQVCKSLNIEIFIDKLHNDDFHPQERVEKELLNSDILILISSDLVFKSEWVRKELSMARFNKLPIHLTEPSNAIRTIKSVYNKR